MVNYDRVKDIIADMKSAILSKVTFKSSIGTGSLVRSIEIQQHQSQYLIDTLSCCLVVVDYVSILGPAHSVHCQLFHGTGGRHHRFGGIIPAR